MSSFRIHYIPYAYIVNFHNRLFERVAFLFYYMTTLILLFH
uniref:Uncharacterized protein n=1 Tax=Siphoviridae sp. ctqPo10 TaxID=2827948 RepID=A0A8S5SWE0_9CAUD|nr:MAG TPA: hypothetical protein [Siphoviridae sp. ctqPo10]DAI19756.1 MAG TPA: hypothetical protein [Caudoviricetes sp.]DAR46136.1 MAG TPA: hypothetical protein [Caudoviricetes sp.]